MPQVNRSSGRRWHFPRKNTRIPAMFSSESTLITFLRDDNFRTVFSIVDRRWNRAYRARIGVTGLVELVRRVGHPRNPQWIPASRRDRREMRRHLHVARFNNPKSRLPGRAWKYWTYALFQVTNAA